MPWRQNYVNRAETFGCDIGLQYNNCLFSVYIIWPLYRYFVYLILRHNQCELYTDYKLYIPKCYLSLSSTITYYSIFIFGQYLRTNERWRNDHVLQYARPLCFSFFSGGSGNRDTCWWRDAITARGRPSVPNEDSCTFHRLIGESDGDRKTCTHGFNDDDEA